MQAKRSIKTRRGSALALGVVIAVVLSAMITALAWAAGNQSRMTRNLSQIDGCFFAAEAGAQRAAWYIRNWQMASAPASFSGTINGYSYTTTYAITSSAGGTASTYDITSVATGTNTYYVCSERITPAGGGVTAIASVGDFNAKNIQVIGNISVEGKFTTGPGNSSNITGDLTYGQSANQTSNITGTITNNTFTAINLPTMYAALVAAAGSNTFTTDQNNVTFNFNTISGNNKVFYVNGNVDNPHFTGTGTLYVTGAITNLDAFGTTGAVYIVAAGDITTKDNISMVGALYTGGNWYRGKFDLTGNVYVAGVIQSNSGAGSLTQSTSPWFDPRIAGGTGSATVSYSNFSGPMP